MLQGLYPAAVSAKCRSIERMSAGNLVLSELSPKIELICLNTIVFDLLKA